ncbi:FAD-dependent oxidoreductase [Sphaerothrix gracilis]|uniref:FAD-dependent oxidoreductase n=1 Tax=Sphaerothrix gracilis TaxID=3151835 RepID=UPI0031FC0414
MLVDYDLVILGGTLAGRQAAIAATSQGARVALVEPLADGVARSLQADYLRQVSAWQQWSQRAGPADWSHWQQWTQAVSQQQAELRSPQVLLAQGVDYIQAPGQFCRSPRLAFETQQRFLTARAYLLAADFFTPLPPISGLAERSPYTPETLYKLPAVPARIGILGGTPAALAIAQLMARLGAQVTICLEPAWLHRQAVAIRQWLVAQLEAEGIQLECLAEVDQVTADSSALAGHQIKLSQAALTVDELVVATAPSLRSFDLGLDMVGVKQDGFGPVVGDRLQTTHPRLFALGTALGRQEIRAIAPPEIDLVLKNALLLPRFELNRRALVWRVSTTPEVARVGITPAQARAWYGEDTWVCSQPLYANGQAQLLNQASGFCQIVAHRSGEILGAQIVGASASELIQPIAQAIAAKQGIRSVARSPYLPQGLTAALVETAQQWQTRRLAVGFWRRDWLENWFNWRRSRVRL